MQAFDRLKMDIQHYIYDKGWSKLTRIQSASIKQIAQTDHNLILSAPTASGKTEAAFIPAVNGVEDWDTGLKILYISPLKALINDQFQRINELCQYLDVPITRWHGEASQAEKRKIVKQPKGILLITPESIEGMLVNRPGEAEHLFKGVEWIIIDELHSFLGTERGIHLQSLIQRISQFMQAPRFIAMSATLSKTDFGHAKAFFGSNRDTDILVDHDKNDLLVTIDYTSGETGPFISRNSLAAIYQYSQKETMLVFPNSRNKVEEITHKLEKMALKENRPIRYFAHHSSVDKALREEVEFFAKNNERDLFTITCTSTLELGIDIGSVDSVVQYGAPPSTSSLSQRLGRSGRRTHQSILHIVEDDPWEMLQTYSALDLLERKEMDAMQMVEVPYNAMAHQMMAILFQKTSVPMEKLMRMNKEFPVWTEIPDTDLVILIDHMVEKEFIEIIGEEAIVGLEGEKLLNSRDFYAMFLTTSDFSVHYQHERIGSLPFTPDIQIESKILLAGRVWNVKDIDIKAKRIMVEKTTEGKAPKFISDAGFVSNEVRENMELLLKNENYLTLNNEKITDDFEYLKSALAYDAGNYWYEDNQANIGIVTFKGTRFNIALLLLIKSVAEEGETYQLYDKYSLITGPNIKKMIERLNGKEDSLERVAIYLEKNEKTIEELTAHQKFMQLVPKSLKIKWILTNFFSMGNVKGTEM
ncbi:DEAD/DEAH box helicase [Carnobacterium alterfunditum]|uniref:DEAD/DEAH box helicase n=1 Tax=Carnobacterium alterfunditum TaxID=28230 RepID=UPI00359341C3